MPFLSVHLFLSTALLGLINKPNDHLSFCPTPIAPLFFTSFSLSFLLKSHSKGPSISLTTVCTVVSTSYYCPPHLFSTHTFYFLLQEDLCFTVSLPWGSVGMQCIWRRVKDNKGKKSSVQKRKLLIKWTCRVSVKFKWLILRWTILPMCTLIGKLNYYYNEFLVSLGCNEIIILFNKGFFYPFELAHIACFSCAVVCCAVIICISTAHSQQG